MHEILHLVRNAIHEYKLLKEKDHVLVTCSGGPDSMALFYILQEISPEYDLLLYLAHLNHGIREEADEDEAFVRQVAKDTNVKIVSHKVDCLALSKQWKMSLEGAARKARYEFFNTQARILGVSKIALGHTAEDQAETILIRLLRGSGLQGMAGIPPIRYSKGKYYIRPLIRCQRSGILQYLSSRKIPFKTDKTNLRRCCTRNRIRLDLIPFLQKEFNPSLVSTLSKTAELLREDHLALKHTISRIEKCTEIDLKKTEVSQNEWNCFPFIKNSGNDVYCLNLEALKAQPLGIQRRILRESLSRFKKGPHGIHFEHIQAIIRLINRPKGGGELDLAGEIKVYRERGKLFLIHNKMDTRQNLKTLSDDKKPETNCYPLNIPGITFIPFFNLTLKALLMERDKIDEIPSDQTVAFLDYDTVIKPLQIRRRFPGDRFHPLGMPSEKKLKEFFIDAKVPRRIRDVWPLLVGDSKIFWVLGLRIGHPYRVTSNTSKILKIDFRHE